MGLLGLIITWTNFYSKSPLPCLSLASWFCLPEGAGLTQMLVLSVALEEQNFQHELSEPVLGFLESTLSPD